MGHSSEAKVARVVTIAPKTEKWKKWVCRKTLERIKKEQQQEISREVEWKEGLSHKL